MKKVSLLIIAIMLTFAVAQNAHAVCGLDTPYTATGCKGSPFVVVSPYYQADGTGGSYTFIGVSHPSLNNSVSQIGLTLTAQGATTVANSSAAANAVTFTVNAGTTHKIFIVNTGNVSLCKGTKGTSCASTLQDAQVHIITVTSKGTQYGYINVTPSNLYPINGFSPTLGITGPLYNNLTLLHFWGAVVVSSTSTGFAMEFIGDVHDSSPLPTTNNGSFMYVDTVTTAPGRGTN